MRYILLLFLLLTGCQTYKVVHNPYKIQEQPTVQETPLAKQLKALPEPTTPRLTVAVYQFSDKTGQRKTSQTMALFSSAVSQGAESYLIESLQIAANGAWFKVLERAGLDDLVKERQMYKQAREEFENTKNPGLHPMLFAGVVVEGGITGWDSDLETGGVGANILSIGAQQQYSKDVITVSLRLVSVNTSEVLLSVTVTKTILSASVNGNLTAFYSLGTKYGEGEIGFANNESGNLALRAAIDAAVCELIYKGERQGLWKFKSVPPVKPVKPIPQQPALNKNSSHSPKPPVTWSTVKGLFSNRQ
jgi:curli production assembly/transport component CsgG